MKNKIIYSGLKNLDKKEQQILRDIVENEYPKIERMVHKDSSLNLYIKTLKKETKKRFIISLSLEAPAIRFAVKTRDTEKGGDWDLAKAAHKSLESLKFEVKHKLKSDTKSWKNKGINSIFKRLR